MENGGARDPAAVQYGKDLALFQHETVDLEGTLEDLVRVLQRAVRNLRNEIVASNGVRAHNQTVTQDFAKKVKEVTAALSAATTCQNALRKTAKERAASMSPEERQAAVIRMIIGLGYTDRRRLLTALCEAHNVKRQETLDLGIADGHPVTDHVGAGPSTLFVELK